MNIPVVIFHYNETEPIGTASIWENGQYLITAAHLFQRIPSTYSFLFRWGREQGRAKLINLCNETDIAIAKIETRLLKNTPTQSFKDLPQTTTHIPIGSVAEIYDAPNGHYQPHPKFGYIIDIELLQNQQVYRCTVPAYYGTSGSLAKIYTPNNDKLYGVVVGSTYETDQTPAKLPESLIQPISQETINTLLAST